MSERRPPRLRHVAPPGAHLGLRWRAPSAKDLKQITAFTQRVASRDDVAHVPTERELAATALGANSVALIGLDGSGQIRASAWVSPQTDQCLGFGLVDDDWRGQGIGRALLAWQVDVVNALRGEERCRLNAFVDDGNVARRRLHAAAGFSPRCQSVHLLRTIPASDEDILDPARPDVDAPAPDMCYAADATEQELADFIAQLPRSTEPCTFAQLLTPATAAAVYTPALSVVARDAEGTIRAATLTTEPVYLPELAKHGIASRRGREIGIVETHLLIADKPAQAQALLRETWRVLRQHKIDLHIVHIAVHSPLRAALEQMGYSEGSSQTRFAAPL